MIEKPSKSKDRSGTSGRLGKTVIDDLRHGDIRRTLRRDLKDLYRFYIDEERRARLAAMGPLRRWIVIFFWLLKSMILKLTPARRILLLISFILFFYGGVSFTVGRAEFSLRIGFFSFIILLVILMLELKDKLLARDELIIGRAVQLALLPDKNPVFPGWEVLLYTRAANDVGGDLVDYLNISNDRLGIMLGDVAGKGLGAALLMAKLQATLRALVPEHESLSELGMKMNEILFRDGLPNRFATLVYIELKPNSGALRFLNSGHMPLLVLRDSHLDTLQPASSMLGAFSEAHYAEQSVELNSGDLLLVYSDGLTEACNHRGEFFGEERLRKLFPQYQKLSAEEAGKRLLQEIERFVGEEAQSDDLSLVILKRVS